jgi:2-polyprenyl-3-methyl-5-hydroxy-6-metoxy-1,4-benzoquinol methylase
MAVDQAKLNAFLGKAVTEIGAVLHAALVMTGEKLGYYKVLAGGPVTSAELARRTHTDERYAREWLAGQAAGGYIECDPRNATFWLSDEQALVLADEDGPAYLPGAFELVGSVLRDEPKITEAFRTGHGVGWHEHDPGLFRGTERFFRNAYLTHLTTEWLPSLDGVVAKLAAGARVADVGCGHGSSTILMAKAFPNSRFFGFDYHSGSIEAARERAEAAGVADRVEFEVAAAKVYPGDDYDLVTFFDCLHDMGDPAGAARHVFQSLKQDGTWMIVEPMAGDHLADNLHPVGRLYYCASAMICTPASKAQEVGLALGAQAGEARLREVIAAGGFSRLRRAAQTPFNMILEARK